MPSESRKTSGSGGLTYVLYGPDMYLYDYEKYPAVELFDSMPQNSDAEPVYDVRIRLHHNATVGA